MNLDHGSIIKLFFKWSIMKISRMKQIFWENIQCVCHRTLLLPHLPLTFGTKQHARTSKLLISEVNRLKKQSEDFCLNALFYSRVWIIGFAEHLFLIFEKFANQSLRVKLVLTLHIYIGQVRNKVTLVLVKNKIPIFYITATFPGVIRGGD